MPALCPAPRPLFCALQAQPGALRSKEDQALLDMAEQEGLKRCPACGAMVERTMGCSHISCRCGATFCFSCGKRKEKGSNHYCDCRPQAEQWLNPPGAAAAAAPVAGMFGLAGLAAAWAALLTLVWRCG